MDTWSRGDEGSGSSGDGFQEPVLVCSGEADLWIVVSGRDPRQEALWHSPDGGGTWENLTDAVGRIPFYPSVGSFLRSGAGWLVIPGETATSLLRTQDRGRSWIDLPSPFLSNDLGGPAELPEATGFADERRGIMLLTGLDASGWKDRPPVLTTGDGGATWLRSDLPADFHPLALSFVP